MTTTDKPGILFMCVANSARSQMAEGIARSLAPAQVEIYSAGSSPTRVNPHAVAALHEIDIDIAGARSKTVEQIPVERIGTVITLCAEEVCPSFPGDVQRLHWPLPDPAAATGAEADVREAFRRVRDELRDRISGLF